MIPRTCPTDDCEYGPAGWAHVPTCPTQRGIPVPDLDREAGQDWRDATDLEDGCYGRRSVVAAQQNRRAAA